MTVVRVRSRGRRRALAAVLAGGLLCSAVGAAGRASAASAASWTVIGSAGSAAGHDQTPVVDLGNGTVMAIGGFDPQTNQASLTVEFLNTSTGNWTSAGSSDQLPSSVGGQSISGTVGAQATLISGGRVLLTGGSSQPGTGSTTAVVWDPQSSSSSHWSAVGSGMNQARSRHVAARVGSQVVIVGGSCTTGSNTQVFDGSALTTASCSAPAEQALSDQAAVVTSAGRVVVSGGALTDGNATAAVAAFNPADGSWSVVGAGMNTARLRHTMTVVESSGTVRIVAAGGSSSQSSFSGGGSLSSTEVLTAGSDLSNPSWATGQSTASGLVSHAAITLGGQVLIVGGLVPSGSADIDPGSGVKGQGSQQAILYDPVSRTLRPTAQLQFGRMGLALLAAGPQGTVVAIGGFNGSSPQLQFALRSEVYTPLVGATPPPATPTPTPRVSATPTVAPGSGPHHVAVSVGVVHPGSPVTVTGDGFAPNQKITLVLEPASLAALPLQACSGTVRQDATAGADGKLSRGLLVLGGQGSPRLTVVICTAGTGAQAAIPTLVGQAPVLVQARGAAPPLFVSRHP